MTNTNAFFSACVESIKSHAIFAECKEINQALLGTSPKFAFTLATAQEVQSLGFDNDAVIGFLGSANQKQHKRFIQFINALNQGLISGHDKSHARIYLALYANGDKALRTYNTTRIAGNVRLHNEGNDQALRERVNGLFTKGNHGLSTVLSKQSNLTGKHGYAELLGLTMSEGYGHNRPVWLNREHGAIKKFINQIEKATQGQLDALMTKEGE